MGLFDLFSPPKKTDAVFGDLVYRRRAWNGELSIPELYHHNIPLEIQTAKNSDLSSFHPLLTCLCENVREIKEQIADASFETYEMYVREDRKAGNFSDADYAQHPTVTSTADIWHVLKPFRYTVTDKASEYNAIIWLDVDWPNPHYFAAYLNNARLFLLDVDG